jgi:diguanylate cyclase (GGDEF)-like protein
MIDLDSFKTLNDRFGHQFGDKSLCVVAHRLQLILHEGVLGRLGGDEFAFFIAGSHARIQQIQHEIRTQCSSFTLNYEDSNEPVSISISIGMVLLHREESFEQALARADSALYAAKCKSSAPDSHDSGNV